MVGTVADEANNDRTHKATIDGHIRATYTGLGGNCDLTVPVCDRVPMDERKEVKIRVHVFNEPFEDVGYDHDADPATPPIGAANGVFDFNDTNGNGMHDAGEASEPWAEISGDNARNTVLGSTGAAATTVNTEVERANVGWTQVCIRFVQIGPTMFEDAPVAPNGLNVFHDGDFDCGPGADEETIITSTMGAAFDIADVYFVAPITGASGLANTPNLRGGIVLPPALLENTYLFVGSNADKRRRSLAHEFGHGLTNKQDQTTPIYVYFPSLDTMTNDDTPGHQRRMTHGIETDARMCRPAGNATHAGNRLVSGCQGP